MERGDSSEREKWWYYGLRKRATHFDAKERHSYLKGGENSRGCPTKGVRVKVFEGSLDISPRERVYKQLWKGAIIFDGVRLTNLLEGVKIQGVSEEMGRKEGVRGKSSGNEQPWNFVQVVHRSFLRPCWQLLLSDDGCDEFGPKGTAG